MVTMTDDDGATDRGDAVRGLDPLTAAMMLAVGRAAALAALADVLDLYGRMLTTTSPDEFDNLDAEIAVARAELIPLLDAVRGDDALGGPLHDAAAELRRHVDQVTR